MAGINFTIEGDFTAANASRKTPFIFLSPDNQRRIIIREISVTVADPDRTGGFVQIKRGFFATQPNSAGWSDANFSKDDPNIVYALGGTCKHRTTDAVYSEPALNARAGKWIRAAGGEYLWVALREADKLPVPGGNDSGTGKQHFGMTVETDNKAAGVKLSYTIYGEF